MRLHKSKLKGQPFPRRRGLSDFRLHLPSRMLPLPILVCVRRAIFSEASELPDFNSLPKIGDLNDHVVLSNHRFDEMGWPFMTF